ncbi:MAG TPA: WbqC family protein [Candidatus Competibacteraceae bacterium]|nr:WbqC family protein [Candidatus Competibacteraceae bacterium]
MKTVAIIQSNYIPWKGYFDIINDVDLFIFYDDVQFTKNDWRNRNKIKTHQGSNWISIPVSADKNCLICEVEIKDLNWAIKHWKNLNQYYSRTPYFKWLQPFLEEVYLGRSWKTLSEFNHYLICSLARDYLGITTEFSDSREFQLEGKKLDRLIDLLQKAGAEKYISGPAAKGYIQEERFADVGICLQYKDYSGYPEYPQFFPPFEHGVTILDLLFHTGPDAPWYIWGWRQSGTYSL